MANRHMKGNSVTAIIRKMQIKTTRYHFTPVRMATLKKTRNTSIGEDMEKKFPFFGGF